MSFCWIVVLIILDTRYMILKIFFHSLDCFFTFFLSQENKGSVIEEMVPYPESQVSSCSKTWLRDGLLWDGSYRGLRELGWWLGSWSLLIGRSFHFLNGVLWGTEVFDVDDFQFVHFFVCCLCFWCPYLGHHEFLFNYYKHFLNTPESPGKQETII